MSGDQVFKGGRKHKIAVPAHLPKRADSLVKKRFLSDQRLFRHFAEPRHQLARRQTHERFSVDHHTRSLMKRADKVLSRLDRKSTRLNSSHLVISYAVFCLKK